MADDVVTQMAVMWSLVGVALVIMVARLGMKWNRLQSSALGLAEYFTAAAIVTLLLRTAVVSVPIVWGTNQVTDAVRETLTPDDIKQREIGAQLTMVNRIFYTIYIWLQKCVVMCVVQHLLKGLQFYKILKLCWAALAVTFVAAMIVCFVECSPFQLYWQVVPDPGTCAAGNLQLIVYSILNILTDIMLMVLPLRQLTKVNRPWAAKIRLILLFMVGLSIIAVTLTRLLLNVLSFRRAGPSRYIANVEIFFAAFVANAPAIYGLLNMRYGSSARTSKPSRSNYIDHSNYSVTIQGGKGPEIPLDEVRRQQTTSVVWASAGGSRDTRADSDEELFIQCQQVMYQSKKEDVDSAKSADL